MLIAKAVLLDRQSEEAVETYNSIMDTYTSLFFPGHKKEKELTRMSMEDTFSKIFKTEDGKPKTISVVKAEG